MIAEDIACCLMCNTTFTTHEELFVHSCAQIKLETNELEDDKQLNTSYNQENYKPDLDPDVIDNILDYRPKRKNRKNQSIVMKINDVSDEDSDYSPKRKKQKKSNDTKKQPRKRISLKKKLAEKKKKVGMWRSFQPIVNLKEETNELDYEDQLDFCDNSDLELSEEFITLILKQLDDLCENIKNGDPNINRTSEVNQNLNNAVHCYSNYYRRYINKISVNKEKLIKSEDQEYYDQSEANLESEYKEVQYDIKNEKKLDKRGRLVRIKGRGQPRKASNDKKMELVKNQCGAHSQISMSLMLHMNTSTLINRIRIEEIVFTEKQVDDCYFCEMKKSNENISKDLLYQFMQYNNDKTNFECSLCQFSSRKRSETFTHIRSIHKKEINASMNPKIEEKSDCGNASCKKIYGILDNQKHWCRKCIEVWQVPKPEKPKPEPKKIINQRKLCPECGENVYGLAKHLNDLHYGEKQNCPHCDIEVRSAVRLKDHIKKVHEKVPCPECGLLFEKTRMKRHTMSAHTPDDQKQFKCEFCPKGFATKENLSDHRNVHTGEKPYKCKFCSACFASRGTHAGHQKSRLGYRRNSSKV